MKKNVLNISIAIAILSLLSVWIIPMVFKSATAKAVTQSTNDNIASQSAQASDHSTATVNNKIDIHLFTFNTEAAKPLAAEAKEKNPVPSPDRPRIAVAGASVTFINFIDNSEHTGLVKAGFNIPFVNIGGVNAKDLTTKWTITDNGNNITGLDNWLTLYQKQPNMVIQDIFPNGAVSIQYSPDIGASGIGTLELTLDYEYTNATTGEKYTGQYKGIVDYRTEKNSQPVVRLLTPRP